MSCVHFKMVQQNYERERLRIPRTHSETGIHREERESQGDREEFQSEETKDDAEAREDSWSFQGYFNSCHHIEPRVQLTCREKNHSLFHRIYIIERNSCEKKCSMGEKSQNIWGKNKFNCIWSGWEGMKGGHKECTQKQKVRKVHFVVLTDIRYILKYEYIPGNVRKSNLKWGIFFWSSWRERWEKTKPIHHRGAVHKLHQGDRWKQEEGRIRFIVAQKEENFDNVCL